MSLLSSGKHLIKETKHWSSPSTHGILCVRILGIHDNYLEDTEQERYISQMVSERAKAQCRSTLADWPNTFAQDGRPEVIAEATAHQIRINTQLFNEYKNILVSYRPTPPSRLAYLCYFFCFSDLKQSSEHSRRSNSV